MSHWMHILSDFDVQFGAKKWFHSQHFLFWTLRCQPWLSGVIFCVKIMTFRCRWEAGATIFAIFGHPCWSILWPTRLLLADSISSSSPGSKPLGQHRNLCGIVEGGDPWQFSFFSISISFFILIVTLVCFGTHLSPKSNTKSCFGTSQTNIPPHLWYYDN